MAKDSDGTKTSKSRTASSPKKKITKKIKKKKLRPFEEVDQRVSKVLMELMSASDSDSVRVAAAKALMDKIRKSEKEEEAELQNDQEQDAAILEAQSLLDALASAKSGSPDCEG
ncbi:MAG TPA: hypothetical protein DD400_05535 [Rhodospirillaceae bacterium]|nr:hypothetical protein [Rhodospirillaceae bacterium]